MNAKLPYVGTLIVALLTAGCQTTGTFVLTRLALQKEPLAVALVLDSAPEAAIAPLIPFTAYAPLQGALSKAIDRPVAVDPCFSFQAQPGLAAGWYKLAILSPLHYARLPEAQRPRVLAVARDRDGRTLRRALLVSAATPLRLQPADLRGKSVVFGPRDDPLRHHAAVQMLVESGVRPSDLALEVIPAPGSLRHMPDDQAAAEAVVHRQAAAGFIEESYYEALPETSAAGAPSRSELRVIGRTLALPVHLIVAGPQLDPAIAAEIGAFLLSVGEKNPGVLEPLRISGYAAPDGDVLAACAQLRPDAAGPPPSGVAPAGTPSPSK